MGGGKCHPQTGPHLLHLFLIQFHDYTDFFLGIEPGAEHEPEPAARTGRLEQEYYDL